MAQDKETARLCSEGMISLLLRLKEQELKIEFLFGALGAILEPANPQLGSQKLQADCAKFVESNYERLAALREGLEVIDTTKGRHSAGMHGSPTGAKFPGAASSRGSRRSIHATRTS